LGWVARENYLGARLEAKQVDLYAMDLLWGLAKRHYPEIPMPSELWNGKNKIDRRSGKQIMQDLMDGLGGE
jgi:hypothetical protein